MQLHPADAQAIDRAAWRCLRRGAHASLERADLAQEGWLALLESAAAGRLPAQQPHRARYLARRAGGAMRDTSGRQWTAEPTEDADIAGEALRPDDIVAARQALARLRRRAAPRVVAAVDQLLAGATVSDAAAALGVTQSAVSQLLRRALAALRA